MRRLDGGLMTESAYLGTRGAEISERSTELVLPGTASPETRKPMRERKTGVSKPEAIYRRESNGPQSATTNATAATEDGTPEAAAPSEERGIALPGDRGRESQGGPKQRPSFWRRIALGRRGAKTRGDAQLMNPQNPTSPMSVATLANPVQPQTADSIEKRVVEPLLQALVSVESKLERRNIDLVGRSEQVEQRLSQLWDIEEQLGVLGELQKSLLQVSKQQRRLESAILSQNRTLRRLVGAVFFSLALAALVVAAVLQ
jgi:hypothetical protein